MSDDFNFVLTKRIFEVLKRVHSVIMQSINANIKVSIDANIKIANQLFKYQFFTSF